MAFRRVLAWSAFVSIAAGTLLLSLGGCASTHSETGISANIVTPSDETDTRRRARLRLELASGYFEEGKTEVALDEVKQALVIDSSFAEAYDLRGLILMRLSDNSAAEENFRRAISLNPRDANPHHNLGWLLCQEKRYPQAQGEFDIAMASPIYPGRSKTLLAQGVCEARAGKLPEAEKSLSRSYELDPGNPVTGYNLANLLFRRGENTRAQFIIRRINNSELANAESLWLGIKIERRLNDMVALRQLGDVLRKRFAGSPQTAKYERGAFDE
ncbi:MAG TPA: type IV pilus biogenesis/stability protein PilW [Ramlibacter sp.]|jgi:type IV pilus assembly protein PilF|nr:type IV pilus biogenesis/stability protein PilW [Ramlibacter sp.]